MHATSAAVVSRTSADLVGAKIRDPELVGWCAFFGHWVPDRALRVRDKKAIAAALEDDYFSNAGSIGTR
jgi:hypothetical protein